MRPSLQQQQRRSSRSAGKVEVGDLIVLDACCCYIDSLYCKMPDCLGCYTNTTCCCCLIDAVGCKPSDVEDECCIVNQNSQRCINPKACYKSLGQCCCLDARCAFPCDKDVPCVVALCGLICCVNWGVHIGCCSHLSAFVQPDQQSLLQNQQQHQQQLQMQQQQQMQMQMQGLYAPGPPMGQVGQKPMLTPMLGQGQGQGQGLGQVPIPGQIAYPPPMQQQQQQQQQSQSPQTEQPPPPRAATAAVSFANEYPEGEFDGPAPTHTGGSLNGSPADVGAPSSPQTPPSPRTSLYTGGDYGPSGTRLSGSNPLARKSISMGVGTGALTSAAGTERRASVSGVPMERGSVTGGLGAMSASNAVSRPANPLLARPASQKVSSPPTGISMPPGAIAPPSR